jgi:hypothetical protein
VQVLHHQDKGLSLRCVQNQVPQEGKGPALPRLWTQLSQALWGYREGQQLQHEGHVVLRRYATLLQPQPDGGRVLHHLSSLRQSAYLPYEIAHR